MGLTIRFIAVGNDLPGGFAGPGHHPQRRRVGAQQHVGIGGLDEVPVIIGVLARHGLHHDRLGQFDLAIGGELVRRDELAPGITRHIGHEAFNL